MYNYFSVYVLYNYFSVYFISMYIMNTRVYLFMLTITNVYDNIKCAVDKTNINLESLIIECETYTDVFIIWTQTRNPAFLI